MTKSAINNVPKIFMRISFFKTKAEIKKHTKNIIVVVAHILNINKPIRASVLLNVPVKNYLPILDIRGRQDNTCPVAVFSPLGIV